MFSPKLAPAARRVRLATLVPPRREKAEFGPYRQKKSLEASASRVVVEHRGVEPLTSTMRMSRATNCANAPYGFPEALRGSFPRFSSAGLETILERGILGTQWE